MASSLPQRTKHLGLCLTAFLLCTHVGCTPADLELVIEKRYAQLKADQIASPSSADWDAVEAKTQSISLNSAGWPQLFGPHRNGLHQEREWSLDWSHGLPDELWRMRIGTGYASPVVLSDRVVLLHRIGDEEIVDCISADDGRLLWRYRYGTQFKCRYEYSSGPYSTPLIHDGCVFVVGAEAGLRCLSLDTGQLLWSRELGDEFELDDQLFGFGAAPIVEGNSIILNVGARRSSAGIVAFDRRSGDILWTATQDGPSYAMPILATIHSRRYLFCLTYDGLVALNPVSGDVYWKEPFQSRSVDSVNATSPAVWNDMVVVMQGPGPGARCWQVMANGDHQLMWKDRRVLDSQFNSLIFTNGLLFGFTAKREGGSTFRCVEFATGKLVWSFPSEVQRGSCLAIGRRILLWGEYGHLGSLELDDQSKIKRSFVSSNPILEHPCYSCPAVSDGRMFVRNEQYLVAFGLETD